VLLVCRERSPSCSLLLRAEDSREPRLLLRCIFSRLLVLPLVGDEDLAACPALAFNLDAEEYRLRPPPPLILIGSYSLEMSLPRTSQTRGLLRVVDEKAGEDLFRLSCCAVCRGSPS
jgi:hypothetical protein